MQVIIKIKDKQLKQQQIILGSITAVTSAMALGYLGAQYFAKPTMYAVAGTMLGLGAFAQVIQLKPKFQSSSSARSSYSFGEASYEQRLEEKTLPFAVASLKEKASHSPSFSSIPVTKVQQPIQLIEPHSNEKLIVETDPIIERFVRLGLEEF